jgi:hypothetical protein
MATHRDLAPVGSCLEYAARHIVASYAQPPVQQVRTLRRGHIGGYLKSSADNAW